MYNVNNKKNVSTKQKTRFCQIDKGLGLDIDLQNCCQTKNLAFKV